MIYDYISYRFFLKIPNEDPMAVDSPISAAHVAAQGFIAYGSGMAITLEGRETIRIGDDEKFVPRNDVFLKGPTCQRHGGNEAVKISKDIVRWNSKVKTDLQFAVLFFFLSIYCSIRWRWWRYWYGQQKIRRQLNPDSWSEGRCCEVSMQKFPISEISLDSLQILHSSKEISGILGLQHMMNLSWWIFKRFILSFCFFLFFQAWTRGFIEFPVGQPVGQPLKVPHGSHGHSPHAATIMGGSWTSQTPRWGDPARRARVKTKLVDYKVSYL